MPPTTMTIRYSEDSNQTRRALPRRAAAHSAGLGGTRWKLLKLCCPWLLERGSKKSRRVTTRSSNVPVIHVTHVRSLECDSDSDAESQRDSLDSSYFDDAYRSRSDSAGSIGSASSAGSYGAISGGLDSIAEESSYKEDEDDKKGTEMEILTPKKKTSKDKAKTSLRGFLKYRKKSLTSSSSPKIAACFTGGGTLDNDEGATPSSGFDEGADEASEADSVFSVQSDAVSISFKGGRTRTDSGSSPTKGRTSRADSTGSSTKESKSRTGSLSSPKDITSWPETFSATTTKGNSPHPESLADTPKGASTRADSSSGTPKGGRTRTDSSSSTTQDGTPRRESPSSTFKDIFSRRGSHSDTKKDATSRRGSHSDTLKDVFSRRENSTGANKDATHPRDNSSGTVKDVTPGRDSSADTTKNVTPQRHSSGGSDKDVPPRSQGSSVIPKDNSRRDSSSGTLNEGGVRDESSGGKTKRRSVSPADSPRGTVEVLPRGSTPSGTTDSPSTRAESTGGIVKTNSLEKKSPGGIFKSGSLGRKSPGGISKGGSLGRKTPGGIAKGGSLGRKTPGIKSAGSGFFKKLIKKESPDESTGGSIEEMGGGGPERGPGGSMVGGGGSIGSSHTLGHVPTSKNASPLPLEGGGGGSVVGSLGPKSARGSIASLASSETSQADEDVERLVLLHEKKRSGLTPLGSPSESMASVCSTGAEGRYGTVAVRGEIEVGLQYNYKEGQLEVLIVQCRDLAAVDTKRNRSDPYVKVYLLPDKSKSGKRKTKVKKHTLNPVFEEVLKFHSTMSELETRTLWVSVWHSDMFGRNDFLGEVILPFSDQVFDDTTPKCHQLQDRTEPLDDLTYNSPRGDLILALKFVPPDPVGSSRKNRRSRGALHVLIKEAKSLAPIKPNGSADPVCKGLLLPEKGKSSKQKTSVCRKTLNPAWNHTLIFQDVSLQDLTERSLEISIWDHDRLGGSQYLGGARLNLGKGKHNGRHVEWMDAAGMEMRLWEQMLDRPNLWVEGSIMLRPSMDKPIYSSSITE